jgi:hypothetical protein
MMSLIHRCTSVAAVALVTAALSASAASARPIDAAGPDAATRPASAHVDAGSESAFDWGDAGIGAGAALATTMIGLGGALVAGARRRSAIG